MILLDITTLQGLDETDVSGFRAQFEDEFDSFARWAFELLEGAEFQWLPGVHGSIEDFLELVHDGQAPRGIINTKPRFGKSVLLGLWCAWWLLKRPTCKFLYLSSSDILAREQSDLVRRVLKLPEVRFLWHLDFDADTDSKGLWRTTAGGYFRAVTTGGQIVGFGAGQLGSEEFAGALIIDDPLKPEAITSIIQMETMNQRYLRTLRHRINDPRTPIVVVMQRLHDNDLSGFLLGGGSGERWTHLRIPGLVDPGEEEAARQRYKVDWTHGDPVEIHTTSGYVWPDKFGEGEDASERLAEEIWAAQTMQNPRIPGGSLFRVSWFRRYERADINSGVCGHVWRDGEKVELRSMAVVADTAAKAGEQNDYSVFQLWGIGMDGHLYLLDQLRGKWEVPDLERVSTSWLIQYADQRPRSYGWREVYIEEASSGIGLIQQLRRTWGARVIPVQRGRDKVSRALSALLPLERGLVYIPSSSPWVGEYLSEFAAFSRHMTHLHDDQIDPTLDAIEVLARSGGKSIFNVVDVRTH